METFLILRIDTTHYELKNLSHKQIVDRLINKIKISKKQNNNSNLNVKHIDNFTYYLYYEYIKEIRTKWQNFLPEELKVDIKFDIETLNLVLFASYEHALFATCGGKTFQNLIRYTDPRFGISMVSKLLNEEKDSILSIDTKGITGNTAKMSQQYKKELSLIDFVKFGKIPTSLLFVLNSESSNFYFHHLKLKKDEKIKIEAGRGLKIKKPMNFAKLHNTFLSFEVIYSLQEKEYLSSYNKIKDETFINNNLYPKFIQNLFDYSANLNSTNKIYKEITFDFIHPSKHLEFITSDTFVLKEKIDDKHVEFQTIDDFSLIADNILKYVINKVGNNNLFDFKKMIQGIRVLSYKNGLKKLETTAPFINFINFEVFFNGQNYIYIDNGWYLLRESFLQELNRSTISLLKAKDLKKGILPIGWNKDIIRTEGEYNLLYKGKLHYIVFDTYKPSGIELCDVLYYDDTDVYLIHIKYGFNESLRTLASQITISAQRIKTDRDSEKFEYINNLFIMAGIQEISFADFKEIFIHRKINFVFAFTLGYKFDFIISENIEKIKSNIAKYSLIECNSKMLEFDYNIYFKQIMIFNE